MRLNCEDFFMAGNHFKGSDSGRPAVPPRPNGTGKAGTPGGAGQGGSGKRVSPGETAMFTALYEQSQKAKKTGRARGNVFAGGATSTSQPSGALRYLRTTQVLPTPRIPPATLMPARPPTILPLPVARGLRVTLARFTPAPPRLARSPAWMIAVPSLRARVPRKIITILA